MNHIEVKYSDGSAIEADLTDAQTRRLEDFLIENGVTTEIKEI